MRQESQAIVRIIRYSLVGVGNTLMDLIVFSVFTSTLEIDPLVSNAFAFSVAVTQGYVLNALWTFRDSVAKLAVGPYLGYVAVNLGCLSISTVTIMLLQDSIGPLLAKLSSILLVVAWGFLLSKRFVFSDKRVEHSSLADR